MRRILLAVALLFVSLPAHAATYTPVCRAGATGYQQCVGQLAQASGGLGVSAASIAANLVYAGPGTGAAAAAAFRALVAADIQGIAVALTGAQTIAGIKTFSSAPVMSGASISAGTIPSSALVSPPSSIVNLALFAAGGAGNWYPTEYAGPGSLVLGSGGTPLSLALWCAPVAGTLRDLTVQGASATSANSTFTIASSPGGNSPIFSTSTVTCTATTGNTFCRDNTHTVALHAFDCVAPVMTASALWATGGASVNAVFIPN